MSLLAAGTTVGYVESKYDMTDQGGPKGIARRLTVSTGDGVEVISISQDLADDLGPADLAKLAEVGRPVVCKVSAAANANERGGAKLGVKLLDIRFVRMADLVPFGYEVSVYVEEPEPSSSTPSVNGAPSPAGV